MARDDDEASRSAKLHEIGQDLSMLSVEELTARVALLNDEIVRLRTAISNKTASRDAAARLFRS